MISRGDRTIGQHSGPSTRELIDQLSHQVRDLFRSEVELAKADTLERVRGVARAIVLVAVAALCGLAAFAVACAALVLVLDIVLPAWAAALVTVGVLAAVAAATGLGARRRIARAAPPVPHVAIDQVKRDFEWLANPKRSSNGSS